MRIIGGTAGGLILRAPKGLEVRPTPDLVRQAVFNSLGRAPEGARVLELFGGTGALALECLSRGAAMALCVEKSAKHAGFIRANAVSTDLAKGLEVRVQDAFTALSQLEQAGKAFDLILADPPYGAKHPGRRSDSLAQRLLDNPSLPRLLAAGGTFILGHAKRDELTLTAGWEERKKLRHGDTMMRFLVRGEASPGAGLCVQTPSFQFEPGEARLVGTDETVKVPDENCGN
jgi:16S rRNA (guanine966-N2)-methyltransferase